VGVHSDETMSGDLKAPFPWFGGKSRAAELVWSRFGHVQNYVEPFAGSLAVLLARPTPPKVETVNDADCYLSNFWRALQHDPETVAYYADGPVNEADLHARHTWLVAQADFRERMKAEPEYFDAKIAGWWVWGQCLWIGTGWCDATNAEKIPNLTSGFGEGTGIHRKLPHLSTEGTGIHRKLPHLSTEGTGIHRKLPHLSTEGTGSTESDRLSRQIPHVGDNGTGIHASGIHAYMVALAARLRRVRVVCGDWKRVCTPAVTNGIGLTGVFLDPPYGDGYDYVYGRGGQDLAEQVRAWAIFRGDDHDMRIALCGYEGEHAMPPTWECVPWKAQGGYGSQRKDGSTNENRKRERIWFSPHCLQPGLFGFNVEAAQGF
jgi:site-specific DNA-adenine methylase